MEQSGWYSKYKIEHVDGSPIDPGAIYFVLRLDTDQFARKAALAYANSCLDFQLGADICQIVDELELEDRNE
jgi:hypothetical protein